MIRKKNKKEKESEKEKIIRSKFYLYGGENKS